jgi:hypothetical protein
LRWQAIPHCRLLSDKQGTGTAVDLLHLSGTLEGLDGEDCQPGSRNHGGCRKELPAMWAAMDRQPNLVVDALKGLLNVSGQFRLPHFTIHGAVA